MSRAAIEAALVPARATVAALEALLAGDAANDGSPAAAAVQAAPLPDMGIPISGLQNPAAFFHALRTGDMLGPTLTPSEVDGCEAITTACAGKFPTSWAAYALATAYHETAGTMQPIREHGGEAYLRRMYDIQGDRPAKARELGNLNPGDGIRFAGRGFVQITGRSNYRRAAEKVGQPLEAEPDLALRPDIAARILVDGLRDGWFTGKGLRDFIPAAPTRQHFANARRIVNGTDKADQIAGYALAFLAALQTGDWK